MADKRKDPVRDFYVGKKNTSNLLRNQGGRTFKHVPDGDKMLANFGGGKRNLTFHGSKTNCLKTPTRILYRTSENANQRRGGKLPCHDKTNTNSVIRRDTEDAESISG